MSAIAVNFVQVFCFAVLFEQISCEQTQLQQANETLIIETINCAVFCLNENANDTLQVCYDRCSAVDNSTRQFQYTEEQISDVLRLICRDVDGLTFELEDDQNSTQRHIYVITHQQIGNGFLSKTVHMSDSPIIRVKNLKANTTYKVIASIFSGTKVEHLQVADNYRTLDSHDYQPMLIRHIEISNFSVQHNFNELSAEVKWSPAEDMVCRYTILWYETVDGPYSRGKELQLERISDPRKLFNYKMSNLAMGSQYNISIRGINSFDDTIEGPEYILVFDTPSCWDLPNANISICPPKPLKNLTIEHALIKHNLYNINVTWAAVDPEFQPLHYNVSIIPLFSGSEEDFMNELYDIKTISVPGDEHHAFFTELEISSLNYDVKVTAVSNGGKTSDTMQQTFKEIYKGFFDRYQSTAKVLELLVPIVLLLVFLLTLVVVKYRRNKLKQERATNDKEIYLRELASEHNKDEMEVKRVNVQLFGTLGSGAFGVVHRGILLPQKQEVAVKMLPERASIDDIEGFLREISLMKSVGKHENIVGIVGHVTKDYRDMMLLTEFCSEGNLLDYLRETRKSMENEFFWNDANGASSFMSEQIQIDAADTVQHMDNFIANRLYDEVATNQMPSKHPSKTVSDLNDSHIDQYDGLDNNKVILIAENPSYGIPIEAETEFNNQKDCEKTKTCDRRILQSADLLHFVKQIATGMEFLSKNKIVHRDLAARNVLLCADMTIKIADFGLSRDIHVDNVYMKSGAGRLPIKWLALESLVQQQYTSQSDVWSYGILLYEIVTLGCTPYPTVPVNCVITYLQSGNRMSKPLNCDEEFYDLMFSCWNCEPEERPAFNNIIRRLDNMMSRKASDVLINLEFFKKMKSSSETQNENKDNSNDSYLKPY